VTDQYQYYSAAVASEAQGALFGKKVLRLKLWIPEDGKMDRLTALMKLSMHLIDRVASLTLTSQSRTRLATSRKNAAQKELRETAAQRHETLQKKKEDERKKKEEGLSFCLPFPVLFFLFSFSS
jgi:hypothetical protein